MTAHSSSFADLLRSAVTDRGVVSKAYQQFHSYSIGNQFLAWTQCLKRGLQPGPMATVLRWKELGRHVRKGQKALVLCQPVTVKRTSPGEDGRDEAGVLTRFTYRPRWFVLVQTDGLELLPSVSPAWDAARGLEALNVTEVPFDALKGNVLGFARGRAIAVSPINPLPHKTRLHELGHVLLGHAAEGAQHDGD